MPTAVLDIAPDLRLPISELSYRATRSGGPGGQHVNTSATRVELWWNVASSPSLTDAQRARLLERLAARLDAAGRLRLVSSGTRSQLQNREAVTQRLVEVVAKALEVPKRRRPTRPSRAAKAARLATKRRQSERKRRRGPVDPSE